MRWNSVISFVVVVILLLNSIGHAKPRVRGWLFGSRVVLSNGSTDSLCCKDYAAIVSWDVRRPDDIIVQNSIDRSGKLDYPPVLEIIDGQIFTIRSKYLRSGRQLFDAYLSYASMSKLPLLDRNCLRDLSADYTWPSISSPSESSSSNGDAKEYRERVSRDEKGCFRSRVEPLSKIFRNPLTIPHYSLVMNSVNDGKLVIVVNDRIHLWSVRIVADEKDSSGERVIYSNVGSSLTEIRDEFCCISQGGVLLLVSFSGTVEMFNFSDRGAMSMVERVTVDQCDGLLSTMGRVYAFGLVAGDRAARIQVENDNKIKLEPFGEVTDDGEKAVRQLQAKIESLKK